MGGGRKEKFPLRLSEWILQLSSGECAGIPQSLVPRNAVIPNGSAAELRHTNTLIDQAPVPSLLCTTALFNTKSDGSFSHHM